MWWSKTVAMTTHASYMYLVLKESIGWIYSPYVFYNSLNSLKDYNIVKCALRIPFQVKSFHISEEKKTNFVWLFPCENNDLIMVFTQRSCF